MATIQQSVNATSLTTTSGKASLIHRFFDWCRSQEKNRLGWLAAILTVHGCVITPLTLSIVALTGNHFIYWPFIIAAMVICLVTNLAAMPTKITIPAFFISLLIDLVIIINCTSFAVNAG